MAVQFRTSTISLVKKAPLTNAWLKPVKEVALAISAVRISVICGRALPLSQRWGTLILGQPPPHWHWHGVHGDGRTAIPRHGKRKDSKSLYIAYPLMITYYTAAGRETSATQLQTPRVAACFATTSVQLGPFVVATQIHPPPPLPHLPVPIWHLILAHLPLVHLQRSSASGHAFSPPQYRLS